MKMVATHKAYCFKLKRDIYLEQGGKYMYGENGCTYIRFDGTIQLTGEAGYNVSTVKRLAKPKIILCC